MSTDAPMSDDAQVGRVVAPRQGATAEGSLLLPTAVDIFDTTLRDGAQFEGISLTVDDKLRNA